MLGDGRGPAEFARQCAIQADSAQPEEFRAVFSLRALELDV